MEPEDYFDVELTDKTQEIQLTARKIPFTSVRGRVVTVNGTAVPGAEVEISAEVPHVPPENQDGEPEDTPNAEQTAVVEMVEFSQHRTTDANGFFEARYQTVYKNPQIVSVNTPHMVVQSLGKISTSAQPVSFGETILTTLNRVAVLFEDEPSE